jgi:hypothetical protein
LPYPYCTVPLYRTGTMCKLQLESSVWQRKMEWQTSLIYSPNPWRNLIGLLFFVLFYIIFRFTDQHAPHFQVPSLTHLMGFYGFPWALTCSKYVRLIYISKAKCKSRGLVISYCSGIPWLSTVLSLVTMVTSIVFWMTSKQWWWFFFRDIYDLFYDWIWMLSSVILFSWLMLLCFYCSYLLNS